VEEVMRAPAPPPKAAPVAEETPPLRALPAFPDIPKAAPVVEEQIPLAVPRAQTVEDED
jgi:hypothetical protein